MHRGRFTAVNRFLQILGFAVVSATFIAPSAQAGSQKKAVVKKHAVSSTVSKRAVAPRKVAASARTTRITARSVKAPTRVAFIPPKLSFGQAAGLHEINDPLDMKSSVAFVIDQDTHEVLLSKNDHAVLPIASLTKLMTGLLISQAKLPMDEPVEITQDDVDTEKFSRSRLSVGSTLTRGEMLHLALMSSENRAAHALGRTSGRTFCIRSSDECQGTVARYGRYPLCRTYGFVQPQSVQRARLGHLSEHCPR